VNWKSFVKPFAVQLFGQAVLCGLAWYWLSLGVSTTLLVAANGLLALVLIAGWSLLDAFGLGTPKHWLRAVPAVALTPLMALHVGFAILIPFLWLIVLFPSVAAGKWKVLFAPGYVAVCAGILLVMTLIPAALLNWIPAVEGLTSQLASFGVRAALAFGVFAGGWAALLQYIGATANPVTYQQSET
jgi:hypothetical protein